ncbi:MAG: hypothetical protein EOM91_23990 [Sphingobacteriia bacterium]|nr:hypothetical protein [Sphingobacteriia bacterium]
MFAVILQLVAIALGLWLGLAMEAWWIGLASVAFLWLLALLGIGTVRFLIGPHTAEARRFGEIRSAGNDREGED